jgi:hypothetical protein
MSTPAGTDADITAANAAVIQGGFNTATINTARKTEDLVDALKNNRARLNGFKAEYTKAVQADGGIAAGPSGKRRMLFHEILRTYGAMEGLKNELTQRGANFDIDVNDHEHPNAAFKRLTTPAPKPNTSSAVMMLYLILCVLVFFLWFFTTGGWQQAEQGGWQGGSQERTTSLRPW